MVIMRIIVLRVIPGVPWLSILHIFIVKGRRNIPRPIRIDAQLISRELKDGRLDGIVVSDVKQEELRSLFRRRNDLVKDFLRIKSCIKMQLLYFGIKESEEFDNNHWSHKYRHWLDDMVFKYPTAKATLESRSMIGFSDL